MLQNERALLKAQNALNNINKITSPDFGAAGARAATTSLGELQSQLTNLSPMLGRVGGLAPGGAMAAGFLAAAKVGVGYAETLDRLSKSFATLTGSEQTAAKHLKELQEFAARTPFEFEDVARASQRFQNMGVAARDVVPLLTAVGNAVAAAGGGSEQIGRVTLALSQMSAKGKVSAEEMNQLAEAGVGGWRILEQQLGRSKGELMKMAEQGQISADTFLKAFRAAHEGGNAMQKQMQTLTGAWSTLSDTAKTSLAEVFKPLHGALRDIAVELANTSQRGWDTAEAFKAMAAAAAEFGFSFGNVPASAILAQMQAQREGTPKAPAAPDANAQAAKFRDDFRAEQERFAKELEKLAPGRDILSKLQAEISTFGDKSNVTAVTEQFRRLREELAASGQAFSDEGAAKFAEWERESLKAAAQLDSLIKQQEERRKAEQEAERQTQKQESAVERLRGVLRQLNFEYQTLNRTEERRLTMLDALQAGAKDLTGAYAKEADELLRSIETRRKQLAQVAAGRDLYKALTATIDAAQAAARGVRTHVEEVNDAFGRFADAGGKADDSLKKLAERALSFARNRDIIDGLDRMVTVLGRIETGLPTFPANLGEDIPQAPGQEKGPSVDPGEFEREYGLPPINFDAHRMAIEEFKNAATEAFGGIAQGFGEMINAFAMGADLAAGSFAKMARGVIAGVASQAAVKAVFELAEGFAALARAVFGDPKAGAEAALHFKSAAVYGSVAAIAGGIARAAGGNSANASGGQGAGNFYNETRPNNQKFNYGEGGYASPASDEMAGGSRGSGVLGSVLGRVLAKVEEAQRQNAVMSARLDNTLSRIQSMPAGQVVTMGAGDASEAIGVAVLRHSGSDDSFNDGLARNMRVA